MLLDGLTLSDFLKKSFPFPFAGLWLTLGLSH